ncbi:DUF6678 family protein [Chitinimonas koreensis]|uniref:DUF6678 family protein n=1 Tax=Chitinimonas koreensis TaxID=356302 RepID=UPI000421B0E8|nr:DUF6678 family protein [Chitinimonas koreensis]
MGCPDRPFRAQTNWCPSYRWKWLNGHISGWDTEWFHHLPFPFVGVEWFDIGPHEYRQEGRLLPPQRIDHSAAILGKLTELGFEFEAKGDIARIWGYLPKTFEDFPPADPERDQA